MNLIELNHALRKLRLGGMALSLETRLIQAQADRIAPIDLVSVLVSDKLVRRSDRLIERLARVDPNTLSFNETAAVIAADLRRQHRKMGLMDLRIDAIAIAHRATLVTANVRDFVMIDALKIEDWTKSS